MRIPWLLPALGLLYPGMFDTLLALNTGTCTQGCAGRLGGILNAVGL